MSWKFMRASVRGTSHVRAGTRLQDASLCFEATADDGISSLVAIISDGAGSAAFGGQGASIACRTLSTRAKAAFTSSSSLPSDEDLWSWVDDARDRIQLAATRREVAPREFAATLVMVVVTPSDIMTAHIGDGAIVARNKNTTAWSLLSAPHHGEYASATFFVTDDPQPALRIARAENHYDAICAFSDGIENLVLNSSTWEPAAGFFDPITRSLVDSDAAGHDKRLSERLADFLASKNVIDRTDDDKTLIVAVPT
jgi:hypothetical protein